MNQKKRDPPRIFYPCDQCYDRDTCRLDRGCYKWQAWFRACWRRLRKMYYRRNQNG